MRKRRVRDDLMLPLVDQIAKQLCEHVPKPLEAIILDYYLDIDAQSRLYNDKIQEAQATLDRLKNGQKYTEVVERLCRHIKLSKPIVEWLENLPFGELSFSCSKNHSQACDDDIYRLELKVKNVSFQSHATVAYSNRHTPIIGDLEQPFGNFESAYNQGTPFYHPIFINQLIALYAHFEHKSPFHVQDLRYDEKTLKIIADGFPMEILVLLSVWIGFYQFLY